MQMQKAMIIPFDQNEKKTNPSSNDLLRHELLRGSGKAVSTHQQPKEESMHDIIENFIAEPSGEQEKPDVVDPSQLALGMTEFSDFLNLNGYAVTERDLERSFRIFNSSGGDISSEKDTMMVFQTVFCKSRRQYETFPQMFHTVLKTRQEYAEQKQ